MFQTKNADKILRLKPNQLIKMTHTYVRDKTYPRFITFEDNNTNQAEHTDNFSRVNPNILNISCVLLWVFWTMVSYEDVFHHRQQILVAVKLGQKSDGVILCREEDVSSKQMFSSLQLYSVLVTVVDKIFFWVQS